MTDSTNKQGGEPLQIDGGDLGQLSFKWANDRYCHHWIAASGEVLMESSETNDPWPASPPMQQIHQQSFPDGREVIFGVGMSGRGHWSASFTLVPDLKCWIVELACRSPIAPESLNSTYNLLPAWAVAEDQASAQCQLADATYSCEPISPASIAFDATSNSLQIAPSVIPEQATTVQWAFRLRLS